MRCESEELSKARHESQKVRLYVDLKVPRDSTEMFLQSII